MDIQTDIMVGICIIIITINKKGNVAKPFYFRTNMSRSFFSLKRADRTRILIFMILHERFGSR